MPTQTQQWLLRRSPALMLLLDGEGRILDVSDEWLRRFGYAREDVVGRRPHDFSSAAKSLSASSMNTCRCCAVPVSSKRHRSTSSRAPASVSIALPALLSRHDADGEFLRTVTVYSEFGEHARLEQRYRDLYRATPALLHTVDAQGRILHVSDRWLKQAWIYARRGTGSLHHRFHGRRNARESERWAPERHHCDR